MPPSFAQDADRLRRFEQKARANSALNHPNILTIYDIGTHHDGAPFIVAELLEGEELRAQLEASPLPVRKAVDYAQQIAAGLAVAHEKGIIHRDLKPENLFVTTDGRVTSDGQKLVFTGRSADGKRQLYIRPLDAAEAQLLPGTDDPMDPFWSPDSRSLGFGSQGKLKRVDLAGGRPQTLCNVVRFNGGSWSRDGVIIFAPDESSGAFRIPATGGEPKPVTSRSSAQVSGQRNPYFLPDGRHFLYQEGLGASAFVGSLDSKEVKEPPSVGAPALYAPPGWLLFVNNGELRAQRFDATRLELQGEAVILIKSSGLLSSRGLPFSVSKNGVLI